MKLAWISDPHFDSASGRKLKQLGYRLTEEEFDGVVITGDISDGRPVKYLWRLRRFFSGYIFFVLGNHDFYGSWIEDREAELRHHRIAKAVYLTHASAPLELSPSVALVGDDGWYDGRNGTMDLSHFVMRDFGEVFDVKEALKRGALARPEIQEVLFKEGLAKIADRAVTRLRPKLEEAVARYKTVIVATHFPPYPALAAREGEVNPYSLPYYSSKAMGDLLYRTALENPDVEIVALSGHVHEDNAFAPSDNLEAFSALADYKKFFINRILHVGDTVRFETPSVMEVAPSRKD